MTSIEKDYTEDLVKIKTYFDDNELVININVYKTEVMLFGTAKRISMQPRPLAVLYNQQQVVNSVECEMKKLALLMVWKCLNDEEIFNDFKNYFEKLNHNRNTRNAGNILKLPESFP